MSPTELFRDGLAVVFSGLLVWAGINDMRVRKIPNACVIALLALFVPWSMVNLGATLTSSLEAAALVFAVTLAFYAFKIFGAGDCKMFSAVALFMGLGYLPYFALATVLAGGIFAVANLASRPQRALVMINMRGKGHFGPGVAYGAAIAIGGVGVMWAMLSGSLDPYSFGGPIQVNPYALAKSLAAH